MKPSASAYRLVRARIDALLRSVPDDVAGRVVPGCPQWTVRQTLSHLVGACSDVLAGNTEAAASPEWTAAQVAGRQHQPVDALLDEWAVTGEQVGMALDGRSALGQIVLDALTHEYDLRRALDAAPPTDDPALDTALGWLAPRFGRSLDTAGAPALRLVLQPDGADQVLGAGEPAATLRASRLDVLRTLTGRRSRAQAAALDWDGDPGPWLDALAWGPFAPPADEVEPLARR